MRGDAAAELLQELLAAAELRAGPTPIAAVSRSGAPAGARPRHRRGMSEGVYSCSLVLSIRASGKATETLDQRISNQHSLIQHQALMHNTSQERGLLLYSTRTAYSHLPVFFPRKELQHGWQQNQGR
jgi:hypothetical protein